MKHRNLISSLIIFVSTLAFLWGIPALVRLATYSAQRYPFAYFSAVVKQFCFREGSGKDALRYDATGRQYSESEFDSALPMLSYRQLSVNGVMPDSVNGQAVTAHDIRRSTFVFRYAKTDVSAPRTGLYVLLESMSGRVDLASPGDAFRLGSAVEFIDIASNAVNSAKSELYAKELGKRGFAFPAQWAVGDFNTRKPYDEGYFVLDAQGALFHMKQVSGKPFIRNTGAGDSTQISHFAMLTVADKRFYGFVFDAQGYMYMLESPSYRLAKLDMPPIDMQADEVLIMANMFYWTVTVTSPKGKTYYALDNESPRRVDEYAIVREKNLWDKASAWIFPVYITFSDATKYVQPKLNFTTSAALAFNLLLALAYAAAVRKRKKPAAVACGSIYILATGLAGLTAMALQNFELRFG
ncbi:MAG: DUF4857 domain-containing protein [Prevotellaceae bacterium]|jgi:hypothetical protein|nr:DUF4857 domain-containing protein [Prevotellaceae bacterium]